MKIDPKDIEDVLEQFEDSQLNLTAEEARKLVATKIAEALNKKPREKFITVLDEEQLDN